MSGSSVGSALGIPDYQAEADKKMGQLRSLQEQEQAKLMAQQKAIENKQKAEEVALSMRRRNALISGMSGGFDPQALQLPTKNILGG